MTEEFYGSGYLGFNPFLTREEIMPAFEEQNTQGPTGNAGCCCGAPDGQAGQPGLNHDPTLGCEVNAIAIEGYRPNFAEYQKAAMEFAIYGVGNAVVYPSLGLAGESGELCNKVKKVIRDDAGVLADDKRAAIGAEIGDCLWYLAALCRDLGLSLEQIASENIQKLFSRRQRNVLAGSGDNR
jgi:NTP pyrophosphatase (non-canonical NTP hydrolase)